MNLRVASVTEDNNGAVPEDGALAVEGLAQPCPVSFYENLPPLEEKLLDGAEGDPPTILPPYNRGGGGGNDGAGMPPPSTPSAPNEPPARDNADTSPTEKHGTALQSDPGSAKPGSSGGAVDVAPNIMVAAGLGKSPNDDGSAGYLVPDPQPEITVGPEKIDYYTARLSDSITEYEHTTNDLRWVASDGLTILSQETATKVRIREFCPPARRVPQLQLTRFPALRIRGDAAERGFGFGGNKWIPLIRLLRGSV